MINNLLLLDVAGAPVLIAGAGIVILLFFVLIFIILLIVRKIGKMGSKNKANSKDTDKEE